MNKFNKRKFSLLFLFCLFSTTTNAKGQIKHEYNESVEYAENLKIKIQLK